MCSGATKYGCAATEYAPESAHAASTDDAEWTALHRSRSSTGCDPTFLK